MAKLTVKKLESLTPADIGTRLPDAQALYGVVKAKGSGVAVMFRWRYRFDGKLHDFGCGTWPSKTLKEIRDAHDGARQLLAQRKDPNGERRVARLHAGAANAEAIAHAKSRMAQVQALQARLTVDALFERWLAVDLIRRKDGGKEIRRMFQKDVLPLLGALAVEDVRKGHIIAVTDALLARQVPRMAKLVFSLIRQMFRFAVDRDIIEHEPTAAIRKARIGGKPTERERVLSEAELRALYRQLPLARLSPVSEAALWLALATGCRIGEILRAEWQHVHLAAGEWFIPAVNSKNGRPHTIFLSDFAARQFVLLKSINGSVAWCFPNRDASAHVNVKAITKQVGDRQRGDIAPMAHRSQATNGLVLPGGKWTPHDLRRTGATLMTAMGVLPEVAEKCLNHTEESRVKRTYQRYSYETEKREAWRLLGERLEQLTLVRTTLSC
jgi:integrase